MKKKTDSSSNKVTLFGGKLFAGDRGFDPVTIIMQIISM